MTHEPNQNIDWNGAQFQNLDSADIEEVIIGNDVDEDQVVVNADADNLNFSSSEAGKNHPVIVQTSEDEGNGEGGRSLSLLASSNSSSDQGERPNLVWMSDQTGAGERERIATAVAHPSHNHFSIYTKEDSIGSGDTALKKRLNIGAGSTKSSIEWVNMTTWTAKVESKASIIGRSGGFNFRLKAADNSSDTRIKMEDGDGNETFKQFYDASTSSFKFQNKNGQFIKVYDSTNDIEFADGGTEVFTLTGSNETNDGMTADPESATEDAFISVSIGSNNYQIPLYSA